jgi:hypothetical protein
VINAIGQSEMRNNELYTQPWKPRDIRDVRKVFNNLYVKNYPSSFIDEDLHKLFFKYGDIGSLVQIEHAHGKYAFVCYMAKDKNDHQYGP